MGKAMLNIAPFGATDIGLRRSKNEDAYVVRADRGLLALADGMGGAAAGEVASRMLIDTALEVCAGPPASEEQAVASVREAFRLANERVLTYASHDPRYKDMGCTAEVLLFHPEGFVLGHVGDSRTYLFRQRRLRQLTRDHSLVQEQVEQGLLTQSQARSHSLRNVILRAVGVRDSLAVDIARGKVACGDIFLLSSDGLHDLVEDKVIEDTLALATAVPTKAGELVQAAKTAGGHDNITVVLCEITP
jgi:protein phosphatase